MVHVGTAIPDLPYPLKRITNFGWYGVQLFFIVSAFTLLLSWNRSSSSGAAKIGRFFVRRFLRIAPMYYFGIAIYFFLRPPSVQFDLQALFANLVFVNSWSPVWLPTVPGVWQVMPGGWSISVEFCFYVMFPLAAVCVIDIRSSLVFLLAALALMVATYSMGVAPLTSQYGKEPTEQFLFFWLPNQVVIFAMGFLLYYFLRSRSRVMTQWRSGLARRARSVFVIGVALVLILSQFRIHKYFSTEFPFVPTHVAVSAVFLVCLAALLDTTARLALVNNAFTQRLGEASFSAYVLHWGIVDGIKLFSSTLGLDASGWSAILAFVVVLPIAVVSTYTISRLTYRLIEKPFIEIGHRW